VTADYNVSSIFSIGRAAPHRFFEPGVRKPLTFEVTIKCFVQGAQAGGDTIEGSEHLVYNTRGVGVWRAWRGRHAELAIDALWQAICLNECLCKVNTVKFKILRSSNGDDGPSGCTAWCGAEGVLVVDVLLHFEALYDGRALNRDTLPEMASCLSLYTYRLVKTWSSAARSDRFHTLKQFRFHKPSHSSCSAVSQKGWKCEAIAASQCAGSD